MDAEGRDREIEQYAAARWRHLVHAAILLGCTPVEAEDLAQTTLLKCFVAWSKVQRADNRDAYVTAVLVNVFRAGRCDAAAAVRTSSPGWPRWCWS